MHRFRLGLYGKVSGNTPVSAFFLELGDNHLLPLLVVWLLCWSDALACYGEVAWVKGAFLPFEAGFEGCQPWVSQDETLPPNVRDQELHLPLFLISGYIKVNVSGDTSRFVLCVVNSEQPFRFVQ